MQEIVLFLTGMAGVASAAAYRKFPKSRSGLVSMGSSSQIQNKIHSLYIEKDILTKTISRLYQHDVGISKVQKDRLLLRYQHQLGIILAQIEKLEAASKHPDLGPVGDGLVTLMDQKLSALDQRLYEISSKIAIANAEAPKKPEVKPKEEKPVKVPEKKPVVIPTFDFEKPKGPIEITTLTAISDKQPEFPIITPEIQSLEPKPKPQVQIEKQNEPNTVQKEILEEANQPLITDYTSKQNTISEPTPPEPMPEPVTLVPKPAEEKIDDSTEEEDDKNLEKLLTKMNKTLDKLDQAEVE